MTTNSAPKFTNAPWMYCLRSDGRYDITGDLNGEHAGVALVARETRHEQGIANARLIAAAPEMYAELDSLLSCYAGADAEKAVFVITDHRAARIANLLRKARGETT